MSIPHIAGQLNNDLYALPVKRRQQQQQQQQQKSLDEIDTISPDKERNDESDLPPGWEKHEGTIYLPIRFFCRPFCCREVGQTVKTSASIFVDYLLWGIFHFLHSKKASENV